MQGPPSNSQWKQPTNKFSGITSPTSRSKPQVMQHHLASSIKIDSAPQGSQTTRRQRRRAARRPPMTSSAANACSTKCSRASTREQWSMQHCAEAQQDDRQSRTTSSAITVLGISIQCTIHIITFMNCPTLSSTREMRSNGKQTRNLSQMA